MPESILGFLVCSTKRRFKVGAWGTGVYDNDAAADWTADLALDGLSAVRAALVGVAEAGYIEAPEGAAAVAAADVVARLRSGGGERSAYCADVVSWVDQNPSKPSVELVAAARAAIGSVRGDGSELAELWAESDEFEAWHTTLDEVQGRLS
ncbi:DUF4259 domain-containing protein [Ilumatobacter sp.]|uniref:DUF4259 domain-containing protein n=1 Tax=Ilumatobacter sp. TaxID=1967498 RepID=UPI003AF5F2EB